MLGIGRHGQVSEIERPQVPGENFGSQRDQPVEDFIDVPQFVLVARLQIRTDGQNAATALFVLEELQPVLGQVGPGPRCAGQVVRKPDEQFANAEIGVVEVDRPYRGGAC